MCRYPLGSRLLPPKTYRRPFAPLRSLRILSHILSMTLSDCLCAPAKGFESTAAEELICLSLLMARSTTQGRACNAPGLTDGGVDSVACNKQR